MKKPALTLGLAMLASTTAQAIRWPWQKAGCESRVAASSPEMKAAEAVLGLMDPNDPYRESRMRALETVRDMNRFQIEIQRQTKEYERLLPKINLTLKAFSAQPNVDTKADLETAILEVEILVDQIDALCREMRFAISTRVQEIKSGILSRPEVMRQLPPAVLDAVRNVVSVDKGLEAIGQAMERSQLEISVLEEFRMIQYLTQSNSRITKTMQQGYVPVLVEVLTQSHQVLGRSFERRNPQ